MRALCVIVFNIGVIVSIVNVAKAVRTGFPNEAFCVDLTTGMPSRLPDSTANVHWMTELPTNVPASCSLQGVLRITPPLWSNCVKFHMIFDNPDGYSFNLGDSPTNVAWGGSVDEFPYDAEVWGDSSDLHVHGNTDYGSEPLESKDGAVKSTMLIELSRHYMYLTNYAGYSYVNMFDKKLFSFRTPFIGDKIYLGLNRVVHNLQGSPFEGRTGSGLCSVCIYFHEAPCRYKIGPTFTSD